MSTTAPVGEPTGADRRRPGAVVLGADPPGAHAAVALLVGRTS